MPSALLLSIEKISSFLQSQLNNLLSTICMPTQSCSYIALPSGLNYAKFVQVFNHPWILRYQLPLVKNTQTSFFKQINAYAGVLPYHLILFFT